MVAPTLDAPSYIIEAPAEGDDEVTGYSPVIIAEATTSLKRLSVSEAVMELDLTGAACLVFQHGSSGRVNIIYRRPDGNVGWIDPPVVNSGGRHQTALTPRRTLPMVRALNDRGRE